MDEVSTVGIDLAKSVFQVHGAGQDGTVLLRKKLRRDQQAGHTKAPEPALPNLSNGPLESNGRPHTVIRALKPTV